MNSTALIPVVFLFVTVGTLTAAEAPVLVAPPSGTGSPGSRPVLAATGDGYGLAWWDYRDSGSPERPYGGFRFARFDLAGNRVGDEVLLDITGFEVSHNSGHLGTVRDGFVLFARSDMVTLHTLRMDRSGLPLAPSNVLVDVVELHRPSVAPARSGFVITYPEWFGVWNDWSQEVDDMGLARGNRYRVTSDPTGQNWIYDSPIAPSGSGFFTAWILGEAGVRLRELYGTGRPRGGVVTVTSGGQCERDIAAASAERFQAVVYSAGCQQADIYLVTRTTRGEMSSPLPLASEPYGEGLDRCDFERAIHAVGAGDRIGVLYRAYPPGRDTCYAPSAWFFAEYDLSGQRIGPVRDLLNEFGLDCGEDVNLVRDEANNRYVLAWGGAGPQGAGVYYLALAPAP